MAETQEMTRHQPSDVQQRSNPDTEFVLRPAADIFENADGITLQLDMPGVSKDRLKVEAERSSLLIEGIVQFDMSSGMEALYADVRSTRYRRSFTLSSELEPDRIEANLKDGVLTVQIPKRAELKPRRIEIRGN